MLLGSKDPFSTWLSISRFFVPTGQTSALFDPMPCPLQSVALPYSDALDWDARLPWCSKPPWFLNTHPSPAFPGSLHLSNPSASCRVSQPGLYCILLYSSALLSNLLPSLAQARGSRAGAGPKYPCVPLAVWARAPKSAGT